MKEREYLNRLRHCKSLAGVLFVSSAQVKDHPGRLPSLHPFLKWKEGETAGEIFPSFSYGGSGVLGLAIVLGTLVASNHVDRAINSVHKSLSGSQLDFSV